jgi:hypothetical protein
VNGSIEGEPGGERENVEFSAPGRVVSTFVAYSASNVGISLRSADFSTFCTLNPRSPSMPPFNPAGAYNNSRANAT